MFHVLDRGVICYGNSRRRPRGLSDDDVNLFPVNNKRRKILRRRKSIRGVSGQFSFVPLTPVKLYVNSSFGVIAL